MSRNRDRSALTGSPIASSRDPHSLNRSTQVPSSELGKEGESAPQLRRSGSSLKNTMRRMLSLKGRDTADFEEGITHPPWAMSPTVSADMIPDAGSTQNTRPTEIADRRLGLVPPPKPYERAEDSRTRQERIGNKEGRSPSEDIRGQKFLQARHRSRSVGNISGTAQRQGGQRRHRSAPLDGNGLAPVRDGACSPSPIHSMSINAKNDGSAAFDIMGSIKTLQHGDRVPVEQRLTTVEVKLIDLELAIGRMQNAKGPSTAGRPQFKAPLSRNRSMTRKEGASPGKEGALPENVKRPVLGDGEGLRSANNGGNGRTSVCRNKQLPPLPAMSISAKGTSPVSCAQYSALIMLLRRERSARRNLEDQVAALGEYIRQLQGGMNVEAGCPVHGISFSSSPADLECSASKLAPCGLCLDSKPDRHRKRCQRIDVADGGVT